MYKDITGIILAGDENALEIKENKNLKIKENSVIELVKNLMTNIFERVILITNNPKGYKFLELEMFEDFFKGKGPLAGIHAGLFHTETQKNFILSTEYPLLSEQMIKYMVNYKTSKQITLAKAEGNVFELAGVYDRKCFLVAEDLLKKQVEQEKIGKQKEIVKVVRLIDKVGAQLIAAESLPFYSPNFFYNIIQEKDFSSKQN